MAPNSQFGAFTMGIDKNLHQILNEVSLRIDQGAVAMSSSAPRALDELQAFVTLDPLLADLHKQYIDARQNRLRAEKEFGKGDGMADMASLLEDSAWCAMQTRYMEVRADRKSMVQAQKIMTETRLEEERLAREEKENEARKALEQMQLFSRMHTPKQDSGVGLWLALLMLYGNNQNLFRNYHPSHAFNRLAA